MVVRERRLEATGTIPTNTSPGRGWSRVGWLGPDRAVDQIADDFGAGEGNIG